MALSEDDIINAKQGFEFNDPKKIRYLAFEGGGGKGIAYLGVLFALEQESFGRILPLTPENNSPIAAAYASYPSYFFIINTVDRSPYCNSITSRSSINCP